MLEGNIFQNEFRRFPGAERRDQGIAQGFTYLVKNFPRRFYTIMLYNDILTLHGSDFKDCFKGLSRHCQDRAKAPKWKHLFGALSDDFVL